MMRLLSVLISFFLCTILFAQDKENQNVELPDFVITGKNVVNIQSVNKKAPPVLSVISKDFLQPIYSTENLKVKEIQSKNLNPLSFKKEIDYFNGNLELKAGNYSQPEGNLYFSQPFSNGIIQLKLNGASLKAYVDNSEQTSFNGSANLDLYIKNNSKIFPGAKLSFGGSYGTNDFKFYAIPNPAKRTLNKGNVSFGFSNLLPKQFGFDLNVDDDFYTLKNESFEENLLKLKGYVRISLSKFDVASNIVYKKQTLTNFTSNNGNDNYLFANPRANLNFIDQFKISLGFTYSHVTGNDYYAPYASVSIGLTNNVTIIGEYSPKADFITQGMILDKNRYFNTIYFSNLFFKKTNSISATLKYEYFQIMQLDFGLEYYSTPNQPYFRKTLPFGSSNGEKFDLLTTSATSYSGFVKLILYPGEFGFLTSEIKFNSVEDNSGNKIPYIPQFDIYIKYNYNFNSSIVIEPSLRYLSKSFTDITNSTELKSFVDLSIRLTKIMNDKFSIFIEGSNLLNSSNYIYEGYKGLPVSINGGVSIRW